MSEEIAIGSGGEALPKAQHARLSFATLTIYGAGTLATDILSFGIGTLLLFYLTIICGLSGAEAGLALGLTLIVDAFVDPWVGSISDNSRSRHGRRHPFMIGSAVPLALSFGLLFFVPTHAPAHWLFPLALAILLLHRVSVSFFSVPYIALGAELSNDYAERSTIVAARVLFAVVANVLGAILAFGVFFAGDKGQLNHEAYAPYAWTSAMLALIGSAVVAFGTLNARHRLQTARDGQQHGNFLSEVVEVFRNRSFCILFAGCFILFVGLGVAGTLGLHANTYFWDLHSDQILAISLISSLGLFGGVFVAAWLSSFLEKRTVAFGGIGLIAVSQFVPAAAKLAHLVPHGADVPLLSAAGVLAGVGSSAALIGFQSMMADAADEHEHLFGARREGLYFAGVSFSAKASSGLGAFLAGLMLDVIGFPRGEAATIATIPAEAVTRLGVVSGPGAALVTVISIIVLMLYRRGRREHEEVSAELARRAQQARD